MQEVPLQVRSLKGVPEECHGCQKPLGTHRIVTIDTHGNPVRFDEKCDCYQTWASKNLVGFLRRAS
jgi:hypothetical protein